MAFNQVFRPATQPQPPISNLHNQKTLQNSHIQTASQLLEV
jgi:hypothetical protein